MMQLKDALKFLDIQDRLEIIQLISRQKEIIELLTLDQECDRMSLLKEKRELQKKASFFLNRVEELRRKLEKEENNEGKNISPKGQCESLGLFRKRKKKILDAGTKKTC